MPCLLALIAMVSPRLVIILVAIFSDYLGRALGGWLWPVLGFFFAPMTTLAAAFSINHGGGVQGWYIVLVAVAVLIDVAALREGAVRRTRSLRRNVRVVAHTRSE